MMYIQWYIRTSSELPPMTFVFGNQGIDHHDIPSQLKRESLLGFGMTMKMWTIRTGTMDEEDQSGNARLGWPLPVGVFPLGRHKNTETLKSTQKNILPETNSLHLKIGHPKRKLVFQPFIFRCYVSFREGIYQTLQLEVVENPQEHDMTIIFLLWVMYKDFLQLQRCCLV